MAYYKIINGIRYDRQLLEAAESYTKGKGEWQISHEEIQQLFSLAEDGLRVTAIEWRTTLF